MDGDAFKKVKSGDRLSIPAEAYNAFVDAALANRNGINAGAIPSKIHREHGLVVVRNDSGANRARHSVLGVDSPIIDPADNESEFKNRVALSCVTPATGTHEGRFVVLAEPIPAGEIGMAYASGVCAVKVDVPSGATDSGLAEIDDAEAGNLIMGDGGSSVILWRAGGTGVQWAIVRIGGGGGGGGTPDTDTYYRLQSTYTAGTSSTTQTVNNCAKDGTLDGTTKSVTMPTLPTGVVIGTTAYYVFTTGETPAITVFDIQWSSPYLQVKNNIIFRRFNVTGPWIDKVLFTAYP